MRRRCIFLLFAVVIVNAAVAGRNRDGSIAVPTRSPSKVTSLPTSAYCNCQYCCGWHYRKSIPMVRGTNRRKAVGITSSGVRARKGTVAVDPRVYPVGTVFYVSGYGYAIAEDRGGAVHGKALELWFPSHQAALNWGRRKSKVKIWYPSMK